MLLFCLIPMGLGFSAAQSQQHLPCTWLGCSSLRMGQVNLGPT